MAQKKKKRKGTSLAELMRRQSQSKDSLGIGLLLGEDGEVIEARPTKGKPRGYELTYPEEKSNG